MTWLGWILTILLGLAFLMSGVMKMLMGAKELESFRELGWKDNQAFGLAIVEIACAVIFLIPRTTVLGAILLTGYLGGAIATHVRIFDPFVAPAIMGVLIWGSLWLRDPRIRALLPIRE